HPDAARQDDRELRPPEEETRPRSVRTGEIDVVASGSRIGARELRIATGPDQRQQAAERPDPEALRRPAHVREDQRRRLVDARADDDADDDAHGVPQTEPPRGRRRARLRFDGSRGFVLVAHAPVRIAWHSWAPRAEPWVHPSCRKRTRPAQGFFASWSRRLTPSRGATSACPSFEVAVSRRARARTRIKVRVRDFRVAFPSPSTVGSVRAPR